MKRTPKLRHFPVHSEPYPELRFVALCGHASNDPGEFVNPQAYKPEQVLPCCQSIQKRAALIVTGKESA